MLSEFLGVSSMCLGVPFIAPRQLGAVGGQQGRLSLLSVGWRTGQSGAPPDSPCSCPVRDLLPFLAHPTVADLWQLAHRTLSGAHRTVRCPLPTVGAPARCARIARPTVGAVNRWLTGRSGADLLPFLAQMTVAAPGQLAHRTLSGAHRTVRCPLLTVGAGHASPADCAADRCVSDRWLTGQSGAPPDSSVNYSRTPLNFSRERPFHRSPAWRTGHCPVHHRTVRCARLS